MRRATGGKESKPIRFKWVRRATGGNKNSPKWVCAQQAVVGAMENGSKVGVRAAGG